MKPMIAIAIAAVSWVAASPFALGQTLLKQGDKVIERLNSTTTPSVPDSTTTTVPAVKGAAPAVPSATTTTSGAIKATGTTVKIPGVSGASVDMPKVPAIAPAK